MFWILQVSQDQEQERQKQLFTDQAKARRQVLAMARLAERRGKQAHKKETSPEPPSNTVGLAKKGETIAQAVGTALGAVPYIGFLVAAPARLAYWMLKGMRTVLDFTTRRGLRDVEFLEFRQAHFLKKAVGEKSELTRLHGGGFLEPIRKLAFESIELPGGLKLSPQLSFFIRIVFFTVIVIAIVGSVAATIVLMQSFGLLQ